MHAHHFNSHLFSYTWASWLHVTPDIGYSFLTWSSSWFIVNFSCPRHKSSSVTSFIQLHQPPSSHSTQASPTKYCQEVQTILSTVLDHQVDMTIYSPKNVASSLEFSSFHHQPTHIPDHCHYIIITHIPDHTYTHLVTLISVLSSFTDMLLSLFCGHLR